jgi:hypothetical protein
VRASFRQPMSSASIANVMQNPIPVAMGQTETTPGLGKALVTALIAGGALGALIGWMSR